MTPRVEPVRLKRGPPQRQERFVPNQPDGIDQQTNRLPPGNDVVERALVLIHEVVFRP